MTSDFDGINLSWGPSLLAGVEFIFKSKFPSIPETPPHILAIKPSTLSIEYDFSVERAFLSKCLQDDDEIQNSKEISAEIQRKELQSSDVAVLPRVLRPPGEILETLRPQPIKPQLNTNHKPTSSPNLFKDFDTVPHDDPFIEAEFNTINDMAELRDVLSFEGPSHSTPSRSPSSPQPSFAKINTDKRGFGSLANIRFPSLSENTESMDMHLTTHSMTNIVTSFEPDSHANIIAASKSQIDLEKSAIECTKEETKKKVEMKIEKSEENNMNIKSNFTIIPMGQLTPPPTSTKNHIFSQPGQTFVVDENFYDVHRPQTNVQDNCNSHKTENSLVETFSKMGFNRSRIVALIESTLNSTPVNDNDISSEEQHNRFLTQLCSWTELYESNISDEVAKAAVILFPTDFEKAKQFSRLAIELIEMGFSIDQVAPALVSGNLNKECAVQILLDPPASSSSTPQVQHQQHLASAAVYSSSTASHSPHIPDIPPVPGRGRKSIPKKKKGLMHNFLSANKH